MVLENQVVGQMVLVDQDTMDLNAGQQHIALFDESGQKIDLTGAVNDAAVMTAFNAMVYGPFTLAHDTPNIDTGVTLFTPATGDRIVGVSVEMNEAFDAVAEQIGLGIADTADADLAFKFATQAVPAATPTFGRGQGVGVPLMTKVERLLNAAPIQARTVVGGNTTGSLDLYVYVYSEVLYD